MKRSNFWVNVDVCCLGCILLQVIFVQSKACIVGILVFKCSHSCNSNVLFLMFTVGHFKQWWIESV